MKQFHRKSRAKDDFLSRNLDEKSLGRYTDILSKIKVHFSLPARLEKTAVLLHENFHNWEITEAFHISEHSIENNSRRIRKKLDLPPKTDLRKYFRNCLK